MSDRRVSAATAVALLVGSLIAPAAAAPAAVRAVAPADGCVPPGASGTLRSWATDLLAPTRAWPLSTGSGVRIAVLDSGVDAHQPLLRGRVLAGYDAIGAGAGDTDCLGTGTQVASTIVGTGAGVAPAARIIPVRVVGEPGPNVTEPLTPAVLARGIHWATGHGADVIDVSVWLTADSRPVREAVAEALAAGVTVVAAGGDAAVTYPAAYPGVIVVGAIDATGRPADGGPPADLLAPGPVPAAQRGRGVVAADGSAMAAGFVAGTAALVRARWRPHSAAAVADRLRATASPAAGGGPGIVNPYLAVTARLAADPARQLPAMAAPGDDAAARAAEAAHDRAITRAVDLTAGALGVLVVLALLAGGARRARGRRWRPVYARTPAPTPALIEPEPVPALFDEPVR